MSGDWHDPFDHHDDLGTDHFGTDHLAADPGLDLGHESHESHDEYDPGHDDPAVPEDADQDHTPEPTVEHEPADLPPAQAAAYDLEEPAPDHGDALPQPVDSSPFPPHLEVDMTPADGQDWIDAQLLGEPEPAFTADPEPDAAPLADLRAAEGADPAATEDPAIRALALFWSR